jgi:cell division protein FtsL
VSVFGVFGARYRGFRVLDLAALAVLLVLALGSYAFKTLAGEQTAGEQDVQAQIVQEQKRIRLLQAEIAHLEDPGRIERLSTQYLGLAPIQPKQEVTAADLPRLAAAAPAKPDPAAIAKAEADTAEDGPVEDATAPAPTLTLTPAAPAPPKAATTKP